MLFSEIGIILTSGVLKPPTNYKDNKNLYDSSLSHTYFRCKISIYQKNKRVLTHQTI